MLLKDEFHFAQIDVKVCIILLGIVLKNPSHVGSNRFNFTLGEKNRFYFQCRRHIFMYSKVIVFWNAEAVNMSYQIQHKF